MYLYLDKTVERQEGGRHAAKREGSDSNPGPLQQGLSLGTLYRRTAVSYGRYTHTLFLFPNVPPSVHAIPGRHIWTLGPDLLALQRPVTLIHLADAFIAPT